MRAARLLILVLAVASWTLILGSSCPQSTSTTTGGGGGTGGGGTGGGTSSQTLALFDELWSTFDQYYSYFGYKGVDWDDVRTRHAASFNQDLSAAAFAQNVANMLQELHDWHVWVQAPGQDALGYEGQVQLNYPSSPIQSYAQGGAYQQIGNGVVYHAWVGLNVAHIIITTLDTTSFQAVTDDAIGNLFVQYENATGMIIDIRPNNGGNENNAIRFTSRFTNSAVDYGYTRTRNGPNHDDFDPPVTKTLDSSSRRHYDGPVVGLIGQRCMSSAEWFTLMLRACGATLMGDRTRGASGNPEEFELSNGVTYGLSRWMAYTMEGEVIEDNGIEPDWFIDPDSIFDSTHDYVLEAAIEFLEGAI